MSNMKIRREAEEAVPTLLKWLTKTKERVASEPNSPILPQFEDIEEGLQGMKDLLPDLQSCEQTFVAEFTKLKNDINHDIFDDPSQVHKIMEKLKFIVDKVHIIKSLNDAINLPSTLMAEFTKLKNDINHERFDDPSQVHKIVEKLKFIVDKVHIIKSLNDAINLPSAKDMPTASQMEEPSEAQLRKASKNWGCVEENVLVSSAMPDIKSCYEFLDLRSRLCLLCFSIFPENSEIKRRPLIYWWVSEGLVRKTENKTAHEVGEEIFQELITDGLIQPVYNKNNPVVNSCKRRPWTRQVLKFFAREAECFDRVCLVSGSSCPKEEDVSTLFNVDEKYLNLKAEWFSNLKKLVVLQLGRWQASVIQHIEVENRDFLSSLRQQKLLKYLSLRGISGVTELPSSLVELISLEILDLRACHNLEKLPSDISPLRRLTHLDLSECYLLEGMPKGFDNLSSLQVLKGFLIGRPWHTDCKFANLAKLEKLRKLSICIGKEATAEELDLDKLKDIENLRILAITWERVEASSELENNGKQSSGVANSATGGISSGSENSSEELSATANSTSGDGVSKAPENKGEEETSQVADSTVGGEPDASESKGAVKSKRKISGKRDFWCLPHRRPKEGASSTLKSKADQSSTTNSTVGGEPDASESKGAVKSKRKISEKRNFWCLPHWRPMEGASSTLKSKADQSSTTNSTTGEAMDVAKLRSTMTFPPLLEKLDLWCLPCWPNQLNPTELKNLKRLYIRGGKLESFPTFRTRESFPKWEVEILRLKYLKSLKVELTPLREEFPQLSYLEKVQCPQIEMEEDFEWTKDKGIIVSNTSSSKSRSTSMA